MNPESFQNLDLDQILNCIEETGLTPTGHCLPLNSLENRVYRIGIDPDSIEEVIPESRSFQGSLPSIVVKFYRPGRWSKEQIQEEHDFLYQLKSEEIPVLTPIQLPGSNSIHTAFIQTEYGIHPVYFTIWPTLRGRIVEEFTIDNLPAVGRLLARIHNVGSSEKSLHRIEMNISQYAEPAMNFLLENNFLSSQTSKRYESIAKRLFHIYEELSEKVPKIRLHGDCHKGNLLQMGEEFTFLDFDDFMTGVPTQDLWMLLPFGERNSEYEIQMFLEGYQEFRDFSYEWFRLIEPLRGIRYVYYSSWIARRWQDPSFPNAFPHFGTESYWEREVRDLEELVYKIEND